VIHRSVTLVLHDSVAVGVTEEGVALVVSDRLDVGWLMGSQLLIFLSGLVRWELSEYLGSFDLSILVEFVKS